MNKRGNRQQPIPQQRNAPARVQKGPAITHVVPSLLGAMTDGREYGSIVDKVPPEGTNILEEVIRAVQDIAQVRGRPCIAYCGNVVRDDKGGSGIDSTDDLPFRELIGSVPAVHRKVDILLSTRGGSAQQVERFVEFLRARFDEVDFLVPSYCMSAGTLFALSGDRIWMTQGAGLGPIDPQVANRNGTFVPAQALLLLVEKLEKEGQEGLKQGTGVPWTSVRIVDTIDKGDLGAAITATQYGQRTAAEYLVKYKFRHWVTRSSGAPVTDEYRRQRANEIASQLASHDVWKSHAHSISREVLTAQTKLTIDEPDAQLTRAMARCWALMNWIFEKTQVLKIVASENYRYAKHEPIPVTPI